MFDRISKGLWWDEALSIVDGCTQIRPGCEHCWSAAQTYVRQHQRGRVGERYGNLMNGDKFNGCIRLMHDDVCKPLRTKKSTVYAVWNDLFHPDVPWSFHEKFFAMAGVARQHIFIVLTKRVKVMNYSITQYRLSSRGNIPPNVWLGVTCEDHRFVSDIETLVTIPASVHVVSHEPALGPIDYPAEFLARGKRGWVIYGEESGRNARRPFNYSCHTDIDQCAKNGVPCFVKQVYLGNLKKAPFDGWLQVPPINADGSERV